MANRVDLVEEDEKWGIRFSSGFIIGGFTTEASAGIWLIGYLSTSNQAQKNSEFARQASVALLLEPEKKQ